uniref:Alternative protein HEPACAM2 n=1 Tax=Homo sapiens TaxID=9606 RepID=L8EC70_HUMAN|nr:alternative protein HEPACAM2 [Homo sapiens]
MQIELQVFQHIHNVLCNRKTCWGNIPQWRVVLMLTGRTKVTGVSS